AQTLTAQIELQHAPEVYWPIVSNTEIMNQKLGLNPTENSFRPTTFGGSEMYVETKAAGITMAYEEFPFEWQAPDFLAVERIFHKGLLKYLRFGIRLEALESGTRLSFEMRYVPAMAGPVVKGVLQLNLKQMVKLVESYDRKLSQGARGLQVYLEESGKRLSQIEQLSGKWQALAPESEIPQVLASYLLSAPDAYAARIRPFELAELYDLLPLETLRFCLLAARAGYLHLRWDMRCPSCKGPKENSEHLGGVSAHAFCPTCALDYTVGFDQNLELTFFPDPALRKVDESHFCAGSPANTPHLPLQANFWPLDERTLSLELAPGVYVFRSPSVAGELTCVVAPHGLSSLAIELGESFPARPLVLAPQTQITVSNPRNLFQTLQLENLEWKAQVCSGALVSSLQEFRDFFSQELPATALPLARQTLLLARLLQAGQPVAGSSTELIPQAIRLHDGATVRSEADAVLAAFQDPLDAMKASLSLFQQVAEVNGFVTADRPLELSISFHEGPCLVENRQGVLDYRGEALDVLLILQGMGQPGSILVSEGIFEDAELKWLLLQQQARVRRFEPDGPDPGVVLYEIVPAALQTGGEQ
ncbi:MAG TPA: DUF5939 domain-containing protein, partial [Candidatus Obscuribacterales bacterium]